MLRNLMVGTSDHAVCSMCKLYTILYTIYYIIYAIYYTLNTIYYILYAICYMLYAIYNILASTQHVQVYDILHTPYNTHHVTPRCIPPYDVI